MEKNSKFSLLSALTRGFSGFSRDKDLTKHFQYYKEKQS
jgi:hypothetical protein